MNLLITSKYEIYFMVSWQFTKLKMIPTVSIPSTWDIKYNNTAYLQHNIAMCGLIFNILINRFIITLFACTILVAWKWDYCPVDISFNPPRLVSYSIFLAHGKIRLKLYMLIWHVIGTMVSHIEPEIVSINFGERSTNVWIRSTIKAAQVKHCLTRVMANLSGDCQNSNIFGERPQLGNRNWDHLQIKWANDLHNFICKLV